MQNFCKIYDKKINNSDAEFIVELQDDCLVYDGHFPGNPIVPGACNIEMVRECISLILGTECRIAEIKNCKFMMLLHPDTDNQLKVRISWNNSNYSAFILVGERTAVALKMTLK